MKSIILKTSHTIKEALKIIDNGTLRIAVVTDKSGSLLGTLNDGDIRRALLNNYTMESSIENIFFKTPTVCHVTDSKEYIIKKAIDNQVYQIPIIDNENKFIRVEDLALLLMKKVQKNKVILIAGGLGSRLKPLTNDIPKPLLKVGTKPILQTIVENFATYGFEEIIISVNYKSEMIKEYFGDGSQFGVNITYIQEEQQLGTAGALSLLQSIPKEPFFVMNADLLTNVNFTNLLDFHIDSNAMATMCVREFEYEIPYGVIQTSKDKITFIAEKPIQKFFINAGIYLLNPKVLELIPKDTFYDMPTLFNTLILKKENVLSFPIHEYWLDIGKHNDFIQANNEYSTIFEPKDKN